jgi:hypothetical protein
MRFDRWFAFRPLLLLNGLTAPRQSNFLVLAPARYAWDPSTTVIGRSRIVPSWARCR